MPVGVIGVQQEAGLPIQPGFSPEAVHDAEGVSQTPPVPVGVKPVQQVP